MHVHSLTAPLTVKLWQATDPNARDFRLQTIGPAYTSTSLTDLGGGNYVADVGHPAKGWTAFFVELTFASGGLNPYTFTTDVHVAGVPEPSSWTLVGLGAMGLLAAPVAVRREGAASANAIDRCRRDCGPSLGAGVGWPCIGGAGDPSEIVSPIASWLTSESKTAAGGPPFCNIEPARSLNPNPSAGTGPV